MKTIHSLMKATLGAVVLLAAVSCTTNYYDEQKYEEYIKYNSPVDSVDQYQDWKLTKELSYTINANVEFDVEKVLLLTPCRVPRRTSWLRARLPRVSRRH